MTKKDTISVNVFNVQFFAINIEKEIIDIQSNNFDFVIS